MTPLFRFHAIVLSITTLIIFYSWQTVSTISKEYPMFTVPIAALISIGIYRLCLIGFKALILNIRWIKKLAFGSYYVEGVWVGFFIGKEDKVRFYIETFEQDFDSITIRGKGFREYEGCFGSWIAENVSINSKKGILNYTYETDAFNNSFINPGLASFVIERRGINKPPYRLTGFSSDLYNPKKLKSFEQKINDIPDIGEVAEKLKIAKELYNKHNYFFKMTEAK